MKAILLMLLLIPTAFALDCANVQDSTNCNYILNSDIPQSEKNDLISNLIYVGNQFPDFDSVLNWNKGLDVSENLGFKTYSSTYIKNAWIKSLAVVPSVVDETLLVAPNGTMQCTYDYDVVIDKKLIGNDCKTNYKLLSQKAEVKNYVNNVYQNSGTLVKYQSDADVLNFKSELNVEANVQIEHYKIRRYCCSRDAFGSCKHYCTVCEYKSTETKTDKLVVSDSINAKKENAFPKLNLEVLNQYNGNTKIRFNYSDVEAFRIDFADSYISETRTSYVPNFTIYNIMQLFSKELIDRNSQNVVFLNNNTFLVKNTNGCSITLWTHFTQIKQSCNLTYVPVSISIKTDKFTYKENETIKVSIIPNDIFVNLNYGDISKLAKGNSEFIVKQPFNRIVGTYKDASADALIAVKTENWTTLFQLGTFAGANLALFAMVRKFKTAD